jgi:signal transduction histidine kinase
MPHSKNWIGYGKKRRRQMAGSFEDFLYYINPYRPENPDQILYYFLSFCEQDFPKVIFSLYKHHYNPIFFSHLCGKDCLPKNLKNTVHKHDDDLYNIDAISLSPIYDHKNLVRYILLFMSDNKVIDKHLLILIDTLKKYMMQIYYQIDQTISRFSIHYANLISQISHDFTTILNQAESKAIALPNKQYAENMLKQLLFYIRDTELDLSEVSISEYIDACIEEIKKSATVEISVTITETLDSISIDVELFAKAMTNILYNAIEAGQNGTNKIVIEIYKVPQESPFIKHDWIVFKVSDSGSGIPVDYLTMVTHPFFTTRKMDGHCGLGLTIAEKIIEAHGGVMTIKNNVTGEGSTCLIYLPDT